MCRGESAPFAEECNEEMARRNRANDSKTATKIKRDREADKWKRNREIDREQENWAYSGARERKLAGGQRVVKRRPSVPIERRQRYAASRQRRHKRRKRSTSSRNVQLAPLGCVAVRVCLSA